MAKQWDAEVTIKCGTEIDMNELRKSFLNAQTVADKNAIVVNLTGDPKELEKTITEIQKKNPELVTSLNIKFDNNKLNEMSGLLSKAIGRRMSTGNEISNALRQQVESGIGDSKVNEYLSSVIKKAFGDKAKVTSGNVKSWLDPIKEELTKFNPEELVSMNSVSAMEKIIDLAQKIAQVQKIFNTTRNERIDLGIDKALDSNKLEFKYSDFKKQISDFYGNAGDFILSNIQKLNTDVSAAYKEFKGNWLQGITDVLSHNGNPQLNYTIGDADEIIKKLDTQIEALTTQIKEKFETAKTEIEKTLSNGYDGNKRTADNLAKNLALYKIDNGGQDYEVKSKSEEKTLNSFKKDIVNERGIASEVAKEIEGLNNQLAALIRQREIQAKYYSSINAEIGSQVASQLNSSMDTIGSSKGVGVAAEPVIDPTAFIAKIEEQLVNQAVKVIIEPTIESVAKFEQLLQQQLPNEFIDVKFNLENGSTLSLDGILGQFDTLKEKIDVVKTELLNLETLSGSSVASIKSIFDQFAIQQPTNSTQFSEILKTIEQLQVDVGKNVDMDQVKNLVQALNEIGKLKISPSIDLSKFSLGGIDQYLDKTDSLKVLGEALNVLANGLASLNIALSGAEFSALRDFTISNEVLENLSKFADGLENLGQKLQSFSSSATGVLSSINQILSQSKSLEYLYNLANSPNSSKQSNIVGNGLLNAFDKSAINTIQHPAGGTDEVAALAKEYQWLTTQAKTYFTLASKYAKGTISSEDSLKLTQLERAMTGAIQRMAQFQETDQSLVTAQTDLQNALNKCGTAVESGLVNNLTKALTQIDTAENKALGFSNSIQEVKDKVVEIQRVFSTGGLIPTSEIEKAEGTLKKALSDVKQLKQDISEAKKAQENEIKNSYKNIFGNYGNTALGKADKGVVTDEVGIQKLVNEYNYLNKALSEYIQLMGKEAANPDKSADRTAKIAALTNAYTDFIARADAGVDTESRLAKASGDLSNALTNAGKTLSSDLHKKLQSYIDKLGKAEDGTTKYSETIRKLQEVQQKLTAFQNTEATNVSQIKAIFDEYQVGADVYSEALAKIKTAQKEVLESQKAQLSLNIEKWLQDNTKAAAKYETELRQLQKDIQKVSTAEELDEIRTKVLKFEESAEKAKLTGSAFADTLKQKFKELGTYLMSFASFYQVVNVLKQGISIAHEYDDAFTEMRKVTDASTSSLKEFQKESFQLANQVGTTAEQLQQSTADWLRLGESFDEAKKSAQVSNVLLNVSEFENIDSATESLVAMSQAYQDLDKMDIVDKLNNVG